MPSVEIAALSVPVLILQGTTDIQVSVDEAKGLKAARPDAELILVDGMNHVMKHAPADRTQNVATYSNAEIFPLSPTCRTPSPRSSPYRASPARFHSFAAPESHAGHWATQRKRTQRASPCGRLARAPGRRRP